MENKIVYIKLDTWNDMGEATDYLENFEKDNRDKEVNYSCVWYDMAIIYCITTTEEYAKEHKLMEHIVDDISTTMFGKYFPGYNPNKFGCDFDDEFEGWAPYKQFNYEMAKHFQEKNSKNKCQCGNL